jgi:hypothetical protein
MSNRQRAAPEGVAGAGLWITLREVRMLLQRYFTST